MQKLEEIDELPQETKENNSQKSDSERKEGKRLDGESHGA